MNSDSLLYEPHDENLQDIAVDNARNSAAEQSENGSESILVYILNVMLALSFLELLS